MRKKRKRKTRKVVKEQRKIPRRKLMNKVKKRRKTKMKRGMEKRRQKTRRSHPGCLHNPLRERQQLPSLPLAPLSNKKAKVRDKPHYTLEQ